ncbi:MAG: hypothetical protein E6Q28_04075 [Afipia sp.]|nr:MAG: hypothetical protein E6Q28_04075 [Afipia sp.]
MNQNVDWYPERPPEFSEAGEFEAWIYGTDRPAEVGDYSFCGFAVRPKGKLPVHYPELRIGIAKSSPNSEEHRGYLAASVGVLELLASNSKVHIYSHHDIAVKILGEWLATWHANGWKKSDRKPPAALEICQRLWEVKESRSITMTAERVARNDYRFYHIFNLLGARIEKMTGRQ